MDIQAGIYVTIVGMALVFSALAILMLAIMALNRVFPPKEGTAPGQSTIGESSEEETAITAAIAVALSLASEHGTGHYSPRPVTVLSIRREAGAWKAYPKLQSME